MNTIQITRALKQDQFTKKTFCGVFPRNKLPTTIDKYPCGLVANIDPSSEPGTHWVAFYFPSERKGELFDSYGKPPECYKALFHSLQLPTRLLAARDFIQSQCLTVYFNVMQALAVRLRVGFATSGKEPLDKHCSECNFNSRTLQSIWSGVCGQYRLFYLCQRSRGHGLRKIVHIFNSNTLSNDSKVSQFVKNHFRVIDKQLYTGYNQISKKYL